MATVESPVEKITVPMALERLYQEEQHGFESAYGGDAALREADRDVLVRWARKTTKILFRTQSPDNFVCVCCHKEILNQSGADHGQATRDAQEEEVQG